MPEEPPLVLREDRGSVVVLSLNRPEKRNALSRALIDALGDALGPLALDTTTRAIVLTNRGPTFSSGMDLKEAAALIDLPEPEASARGVADLQAYGDLLDQIHTFPRPIVAAVQGDALAGGAGLALACDLVVMASSAMLGYPEVRRGIVASVVMHDLARLVGDRRARQLLLTGEPIDADSALAWGLINAVVSPDACLEHAVALAACFQTCAPQSLATTKQLLDESYHRPPDLRGPAAVSASLRATDEATEGIRAFLEKRPCRWTVSDQDLPNYHRHRMQE